MATLRDVSKLVREVKRTASQKIVFHRLDGVPWYDAAVVVYVDASSRNRQDGSSTGGIATTVAG
eukprot:15191505-Alexandrium_andersonii.AAC.1